MKFSEMPYARPNVEAVKSELKGLTEALENAKSYSEAKEIFLKKETLLKKVYTLSTLVSIRHSIDTRDEFYDNEEDKIAG